LSYGQFANAFYQGVNLDPLFGHINTDNADLSGLKQTKAKVVTYHSTNDTVIPLRGTINYYTRVANLDGGFAKTQQYNRLFIIPGMDHCLGMTQPSGVAGPPATVNSVPVKLTIFGGDLYTALTNWVENGTAPASGTLKSADASTSQLLCPYPQKASYNGTGAISAASSYTCK